MKTRPLSTPLLAVLAAALLATAVPLRQAFAQTPSTDTKIRLMSEALRARDAGNLPAAQRALAQLASLSPDDKAVQRLRAEVEAQAVAQASALEQQSAREAAAVGGKLFHSLLARTPASLPTPRRERPVADVS